MRIPTERRAIATAAVHVSGAELWVASLVLFTVAYFHGGAASNQNARLDAAFSFVEPGADRGSFRIDRFLVSAERNINTADWARAGGHYYANKAPGTLILAAFAYAAIYGVERLAHLDIADPLTQIVDSYVINLAVSAIWLALAAMFLCRLLSARMAPRRAAWFSLVAVLGTGLSPYATQLWGHATAAAFVMFAVYQLQQRSARAVAWGAFWLGAAVCTDYLAALAACGIAITHGVEHPRDLRYLVLGALLPLGVLLAYQSYCFGSPWLLATTFSNPMYIEHGRALGMFGLPSPEALWQITFGLRRGIFTQMPVLWLALFGIVDACRRKRHDIRLVGYTATFALALLTVASFNGWHGGSSVCARYLLPFLPLLFVAGAEFECSGRYRWLAIALAALSVFNMLAIAAVNPLCPDADPNPLYGYTYRLFLRGDMAPYPFPIRLLQYDPQWPALREWAMWNWGELVGLRGLRSLLPLAAAWSLAGWRLARWVEPSP